MKDYVFNEYDLEAARKLDAFLPDKIYDAHMHISLYPFYNKNYFGFKEYCEDMAPLLGKREVRCHALATPTDELKTAEGQAADRSALVDASALGSAGGSSGGMGGPSGGPSGAPSGRASG